MRKYIGPPSTIGPLESVIFLCAFASLVLNIVGLSTPYWKEYVTRGGQEFNVGLWNGCVDQVCGYPWSKYSPFLTIVNGNVQGGLYASDNTPPAIVTAQAFLTMAVVLQLVSMCCWAGGSLAASISLLIPAIFTTVGLASAVSYFQRPSGNPENALKLQWGYSAECAFAGFILLWISFLAFFLDFLVRCVVTERRLAALEREAETMDAALQRQQQGTNMKVLNQGQKGNQSPEMRMASEATTSSAVVDSEATTLNPDAEPEVVDVVVVNK